MHWTGFEMLSTGKHCNIMQILRRLKHWYVQRGEDRRKDSFMLNAFTSRFFSVLSCCQAGFLKQLTIWSMETCMHIFSFPAVSEAPTESPAERALLKEVMYIGDSTAKNLIARLVVWARMRPLLQ